MALRISDTFMEAFAELAPSEQSQTLKCLKTFRRNKQATSLRLHKLEHPSGDLYSISPNKDLRIILYGVSPGAAVYVDHHDAAYQWASRRSVVANDNHGLLEIVPTEYTQSSTSHVSVDSRFGQVAERLTDDGLPSELADLIRSAHSEDEFLDLVGYLSPSLQDIVLDYFTSSSEYSGDLSDFRSQVTTVVDDAELENALEYPLDKWRIFLHSKQDRIVSAATKERIAITGGPGTGKTVVLVHRANRLLERFGSGRVLFLTFEAALAEEVIRLLKRLDSDTAVQTTVVTNDDLLDLDLEAENGKLYLGGERIRHILVDEAQDADNETLKRLETVVQETEVGVTVAYDLNQSIYRGTKPRLFHLIDEHAFRRQSLTFSYRTTAQIAHYLSGLRTELERLPTSEERMLDAKTSSLRTGLKGPEVIVEEASSAISRFEHLKLEYSVDELFITNTVRYQTTGHRRTQYFNPEMDEEFSSYYRSPFRLKGLEFYVGVIIAPSEHASFTADQLIPERYSVRGSLSSDDITDLQNYYLPQIDEDRLELEIDGENRIVLSWQGAFPDNSQEQILKVLGHNSRLNKLVCRLKEKVDQRFETADKHLLFPLNLLHVAVSRCRDTVLIGTA